MRTYSFEKRYGIRAARPFLCGGEGKKKFEFLECLTSNEEGKAAGPNWFADYMDSRRYPDGSYEHSAKPIVAKRAKDLYGTCAAVCAFGALGIEPPAAALDYVEALKKNDGSFRLGPKKYSADLVTTYFAALALHFGGRKLPKESREYIKNLRNPDGSYSPNPRQSSGALTWTRLALTVLNAAGNGLSQTEKEETEDYILSKLEEEGFDGIDNCYDALVSFNMLGSELAVHEKEKMRVSAERAKASSNEEKFRILVIKELAGARDAQNLPVCEEALDGMADSLKEVMYAIWITKLTRSMQAKP